MLTRNISKWNLVIRNHLLPQKVTHIHRLWGFGCKHLWEQVFCLLQLLSFSSLSSQVTNHLEALPLKYIPNQLLPCNSSATTLVQAWRLCPGRLQRLLTGLLVAIPAPPQSMAYKAARTLIFLKYKSENVISLFKTHQWLPIITRMKS